jgi:hypothetical protein
MKKLMTLALAGLLAGITTTPVWAQSSKPTTTHAPAKKKTTHKKTTAKKSAKRTKRTAKKAPTSTRKNG